MTGIRKKKPLTAMRASRIAAGVNHTQSSSPTILCYQLYHTHVGWPIMKRINFIIVLINDLMGWNV